MGLAGDGSRDVPDALELFVRDGDAGGRERSFHVAGGAWRGHQTGCTAWRLFPRFRGELGRSHVPHAFPCPALPRPALSATERAGPEDQGCP